MSKYRIIRGVESIRSVISSGIGVRVALYDHHLRRNFDRLETVVFPFRTGKRLGSSTGHWPLRPSGS